MAGYRGYSMSNNAVLAYESGERPISKWTKTDILDRLNVSESKMSVLKRIPVSRLKDLCLVRSSWHHTSSHYNRTDFYIVTDDRVKSMSIQDLMRYTAKVEKPVEKPVERTARYLEWSGTRKHPKAVEVESKGIVKGNWFYLPDGTKKSINARGFWFVD